MIFRPELVALILDGEKTMTRRPIKKGQTECRYQPGRSYALQSGRGKRASNRIIITEVHQEDLAEISEADAKAEGFPGSAEFFAYWRELHGTGPLIRVPVWVISFILDREERPRFLSRGAGADGRGYGDTARSALPSGQEKPEGALGDPRRVGLPSETQGRPPEPEPVDEATQDRLTAEGWERFALRNPEKPLEDRLRVVRAEARAKGVDTTRLEASIERRIKAYERVVRAKAA